jgi:hypothetical protein
MFLQNENLLHFKYFYPIFEIAKQILFKFFQLIFFPIYRNISAKITHLRIERKTVSEHQTNDVIELNYIHIIWYNFF